MKIYFKYLNYIVRHKWFVLIASIRIKAPLFRAIIHDWSKLLPSEFIPYAKYFYGHYLKATNIWAEMRFRIQSQEQVNNEFDLAWLYHQKRNKHHWQYWMLQKDDGDYSPLPMPEKYILEMVADWMGAGRAITGKWEVKEWYEKNKDKIILYTETREIVEKLINNPKEQG